MAAGRPGADDGVSSSVVEVRIVLREVLHRFLFRAFRSFFRSKVAERDRWVDTYSSNHSRRKEKG